MLWPWGLYQNWCNFFPYHFLYKSQVQLAKITPIHLSVLIMTRKYLLLCPAYWTQWEQHGELRSPCNSGVRAFGPIKQLGDSDSSYIALQYRHSKCYPLSLHSITIDLYTVTGQDRDGQLNFDHLIQYCQYLPKELVQNIRILLLISSNFVQLFFTKNISI